MLDAGTGAHSFRWARGLGATELVGVTADPAMRAEVARDTELHHGALRAHERLVVGNWTDPLLLGGERFDTVLADYLLGAIDGFAPYFQEALFGRLRPHVSGRLYAVGLEPWPDRADEPGAQLVVAITRLRDACILLAGDRCYREYPRRWVEARLRQDGYRVLSSTSFPILVRERFVDGQLDVCVRKLPRIEPEPLRHTLRAKIDQLRALSHAHLRRLGPIHAGEDWVISAEPS